MQNGGRAGDRQVVPKAWLDDCAAGHVPVALSPYRDSCPEGAYGNFWSAHNSVPGDFMARGVDRGRNPIGIYSASSSL